METHFPPPTPTPTQAQHKHKDHWIVHSIVRPPVHSLFVRSSDHSWFVRSCVRLFVQVIFVQPLCCQNSDRSFVRSFDRSSVCSESLFIVRSYDYSTFIVHLSFIHSHYSPFIVSFIVTIHRIVQLTIHRYYSSLVRSPTYSNAHPSYCPAHLRLARPIFQSYELR
jgi:hypothetical protein